MGLALTAIEHACQVIRRQIEDEFGHILPLFIVYEPGRFSEALEAKRSKIESLSAGDQILQALLSKNNDKETRTQFVGLGVSKSLFPFSLFKPSKTIPVFVLNADHFSDDRDLHQNVWFLVAQGFFFIRQVHEKNRADHSGPCFIKAPSISGSQARLYMLCDVFSALMLEFEGKEGAIQELARRRSLMTMRAEAYFEAEFYPYPITLEALEIIWEEFHLYPYDSQTPIKHALDIADEINQTFDRNALTQWFIFAEAAQEMAWMGESKNKILSSAVFNSENPYVRSVAYLVSEILDVDPVPLGYGQSYNSFMDESATEALHYRLCYAVFESCVSKLRSGEYSTVFLEEARCQNERLLEGDAGGWCAYALIGADQALRDNASVDDMKRIFDSHLQAIPWGALLKLKRKILHHKRRQDIPDVRMLLEICEGHEAWTPVAESFKNIPVV